jgi:long-chain acyl-CoA synthetase
MNVTHGLRRALQINAGAIALRFGDRRRTWAEIGDRVARCAGALRAMDVAAGDRVAVLMLNQDRYLELYLAIAWAGAVIVPVNIRWSPAEIEDSLRDCRPVILVVDDAFAQLGGRISRSMGMLRLIHADDGAAPEDAASYEALLEVASPVEDVMCGDNDLAGIFYTGGTTGRSKGVMLSHGNLMANAFNALAEGLFPSDSIYLHAAPMFHLANGCAMYSLVLRGSSVVVRAFSPDVVMQAIERYRVNELLLVPTMIQILVDHPSIDAHDLSSIRRIVFGASPMSEALLDRAMAVLATTQFVQVYGMTELSPIATALHHREQIGEGRKLGRHRSGGRATVGVEVRIVDADDVPVPPGTVGEICARGDVVMMGLGTLGGDREGFGRWLDAYRRRRLHGPGRLCLHRGQDQGHDHLRRRKRVFRRSRECRGAVSRSGAVRGNRNPKRPVGRGGPCGGRATARRDGEPRDLDRVLP